MLEGPYAWEIMAEVYGFDIIGLPYYEYMNTDDELMIFRQENMANLHIS